MPQKVIVDNLGPTYMKSGFLSFLILSILLFGGRTFGREVKIALGLSKPPYIIQETNSGLEYDIVAESLKAVGHELKPLFASLNRGEISFKAKDVDAAATKRESSLNGGRYFASDTYINYNNFAASLKERNLKIQNISDLGKYSVTAFQTAKVLMGPEFKAMADRNPKYNEVADQQIHVAQLLRKRVDVIIGDILIIKYYQRKFKEEGLTDEFVFHDLFPTNSYVILFHDRELRDSFNKGLALIREKKIYSALIDRYANLGDRSPPPAKIPTIQK
ncbi:MAG: substrate-binding periplasmic protein [Pseudobdellovibrionaceae bacterium]